MLCFVIKLYKHSSICFCILFDALITSVHCIVYCCLSACLCRAIWTHWSRYVTIHLGQLSLAIPSWVGAMSTSQRAVTPCGWGLQSRVWFVCGWQVKLCDPLVTHGSYLSALEIKGLYLKRYMHSSVYLLFFTFSLLVTTVLNKYYYYYLLLSWEVVDKGNVQIQQCLLSGAACVYSNDKCRIRRMCNRYMTE